MEEPEHINLLIHEEVVQPPAALLCGNLLCKTERWVASASIVPRHFSVRRESSLECDSYVNARKMKDCERKNQFVLIAYSIYQTVSGHRSFELHTADSETPVT